jgi:heavy metal sensor kinase
LVIFCVTKPRATSIQFRLTAAYTAILGLTFALIGLGVWLALNHSIEETADRELRTRLADVRSYFNGFSPDDLKHLEEEFREESLLGQFGANIRICDLKGKWLFRTPGTERWPIGSVDLSNLTDSGRMRTIRVRHELLRVLTAPVRVGIVQIGLPVDEFEEVKDGFLWLIGIGSPVLLLLSWLGGYWISGRALKPVDEISRAAVRIGASQLTARLPSSGVGDELDRLSGVLNEMLARLESAFKRITEFTADASHELRTPVAIIQTTAELMQTLPRTTEEHLSAWSRVRAETEHTTRLISDLLLLARADAGKSELEFNPLDLAEVVKTATDEMRVMAEAKGVTLIVNIESPCVINGDEDALRRALCILLDNAIKFTTTPGEIRVLVETGKLTVSDTGVGIASEDLPLIFERFYRVSKDRSHATGGTGLGLSIARWIVEQHGAEIHAQSRLGTGSVFTISWQISRQPLCPATPHLSG